MTELIQQIEYVRAAYDRARPRSELRTKRWLELRALRLKQLKGEIRDMRITARSAKRQSPLVNEQSR